MSAPVDVLAVMRWASVSADAATESRECDEARAAVAELIANATELLRNAEYADGQGVILTQDAEALEAALVRCKGTQA